MVAPDFSKSTIDILAKRACFQCSNPDCATQTVGPNNDPAKATIIGEAAHIMAAQPGGARYDADMSDTTRAAITNGIWLCRNCHRQIDRDAIRYPADLLFAWRKDHEDRVARELGSRGDHIRHEIERESLNFLSSYPPIIQRIVLDKPIGWEWRFVAELMRHLNKPQFKRLRNLQAGHYY
ncbi:HNH endonuclease [Stappia sp.]|uniref:HNH endonuclease n=1 Tax=Stappia sp. TaxID=1870903 RepID=UPI00345606E2